MEVVREESRMIASAYYEAVSKRDIQSVARLLHPDVRLLGPLGNAEGKESVLQAVTRFAGLLKSLRVNICFGSGDQAVVNYDADCGEPFGVIRSVALISLKDDRIARIELFFDARPFEK
jgi:ketosteroid isomerase-like protein